MKVTFRVDASTLIGSGHVMRCLTLADALRTRSDRIHFVCRDFPGHMVGVIRDRGYPVTLLPAPTGISGSSHDEWLGVSQEQDARETIAAVNESTDLIVVDHYGIGSEAETHLRTHCAAVMVIDDLANRFHDCDVLLDQNFLTGMETRYRDLTPPSCLQLIGPHFALVRPEFARLRKASLRRRKAAKFENILIFMGGGDANDDTSAALSGLLSTRRIFRRIDVIVGASYEYKDRLSGICGAIAGCQLHIQTPDMALLMSQADFAITAGGSVSWEKCALGLPSMVTVQAENQRPIAEALAAAGAQINLGDAHAIGADHYAQAIADFQVCDLIEISQAAANICDGQGAGRLLASLPQL